MKISNTIKLIACILIVEMAGYIGSFFTTPAIPTWYATLIKPVLNPPSWVFAPVWTILFALMGIALFLVFRKGWSNIEIRMAVNVFAVQLILNVFWSIIFFGNQNPGLAFIEIILLWLAILFTIIMFSRISKAAAWLLVPYILWVTFAAYLNYAIWALN